MIGELLVPLFDVLMALSHAMDLVSPVLVNHHFRVAYIACSLADELGLSRREKNLVLTAGLLHDVGSLEVKERIDLLKFDVAGTQRHAEMGYRLLRTCGLLDREAEVVRFHHTRWEAGQGSECGGHEVPRESHVLHLADRIAVLIEPGMPILQQTQGIVAKIEEGTNHTFVPEFVAAFKSLAGKESFWLDVSSPSLKDILYEYRPLSESRLSLKGLLAVGSLTARLVDFRSRFTAAHVAGVAGTAAALARAAGLSPREQDIMRLSGYLHDLGKLAVPNEILEKAGRLTAQEFALIRTHTYYTYRILEKIPGLETVNAWASLHHERLDGSGYPFHLKGDDLPFGSRIMAVADVFTALTEDRPYRNGMTANEAVGVIERMVREGALDPLVGSLLKDRLFEIDEARRESQRMALGEFRALRPEVDVPPGA